VTAAKLSAPSVVVFDRQGHLASLQRSVLRSMGASNSGLVSCETALLKELVIGRQVVLLNWSDDWDELIDLIKAVRNKTTSPDPFVGIVVAASCLDASRARAAIDAGVSSLVAVPFSAGHVIAHVARVAAKSWRFIDAPNYFGPDRRVHREPHDNGERRERQCRVLEGSELIAERQRMRSTTLAAFEIKVAHAE
jgi:two-component system, chemotaxis family, chemotaxis protein CheY